MYCTHCGGSITGSAGFCAKCGAPVQRAETPPMLCRDCGVMNPPEAKTCASCGSGSLKPKPQKQGQPLDRWERDNPKLAGRVHKANAVILWAWILSGIATLIVLAALFGRAH